MVRPRRRVRITRTPSSFALSVRQPGAVAAVTAPGWRTLKAKLLGVRVIRTRRRGLTIVRGLADDGTAAIPVMWFNRPYLANQVQEGQEYLLHGQVREGKS